jgi:hypothetical protein
MLLKMSFGKHTSNGAEIVFDRQEYDFGFFARTSMRKPSLQTL